MTTSPPKRATTTSTRHLVVRLPDGARLPDALLDVLRDEVVLCGHIRGSGILSEVELRAYDARAGAPAAARRIQGPVQAVTLDGSVGLAQGDVSCGLRVVLSRETESGLETLAGEIAAARVVGLEVFVTALDDIAVARKLDRSGVLLVEADGPSPAAAAAPAPAPAAAPAPPPAPPPAPAPSPAPAAAPAWAAAARVSDETPKPTPRPSPTFTAAAMPQRPARPVEKEEEDQTYPDAGDVVEHFAFGRCEVVKSDGDRLHLRVGKDQRVREIALEMLKVTPLEPAPGTTGRHFRLDRKL